MEIPQGARKTKMEMETRTIYLALALALLIGKKTSGHRTADERELQSNPRQQQVRKLMRRRKNKGVLQNVQQPIALD
ncbi:unnamed protein product [Miscanthus lutarioriparius]|uniref:Uncharacterized protein n=1 Tax=Miscanthus lutarioriparius TaxID=422564 RepID=A0A811N9Y7_9POAL|nr:unnamed protein product [Miscanthus lutarioriparius]